MCRAGASPTPARCSAGRWTSGACRMAATSGLPTTRYWREHWWQILTALAIIVGQSLLIATLFAQRRRSRVAEAESRQRLSEMAHMNRRVALGEMSASIAHELNQPLGAIHNNAGAAEILLSADPPKLDEVADILGDIKRDDRRASDIIARIRKFLRKSEFELRETDLNEAIDESMQTVAGEAQDKGIEVKTQLEPVLPKVNADRIQLQQVIVNLALNAMEAMQSTPTQRRVLTVRSRRADDKFAEVSVTDSGGGIPDELRARIFEPFVTSKVDRHGPRARDIAHDCRSARRQNTGRERAGRRRGIPLHAAVRVGTTRMTAASCIVHVVDDDASWRGSMARLLGAVGYQVKQYDSAERFLETADAESPGCVLLDLRMPGLSGLQLQQRLAEMRHALPVVFLSGHGDIPSSVLAMKGGAHDFLTKPVDTDVLLGAVEQAIARDRENRSRQAQLDAQRALVDALTPTERKVFDQVVRGKLNKQIALDLGTAERTIKWHRHNLMQKLHLQSLAELVSLAERLGMVGAHDLPRDVSA